MQRLGNNPKYKETILYLKGELRKAYTTLTDSRRKIEYDLTLLTRRVEELERETNLLTLKGYLVGSEVRYLRKRAKELKIPKTRLSKIIDTHPLEKPSLGQTLVTLLPWRYLLANRHRAGQNGKGEPGAAWRQPPAANSSAANFHRPGIPFFLAVIVAVICSGVAIFFYIQANYYKQRLAIAEKRQQLSPPPTPMLQQPPQRQSQRVAFDSALGEMVYIPSGYFYLGYEQGNNDELPVRKIYLDAYYIKKHEVTNREYREFVRACNYPIPYQSRAESRPFNWDPLNRTYPTGTGDHPVVLINWHDAQEYCRWLGQRQHLNISLPTEAQWEKAARGGKKNLYPWGNKKPDADGSYRANYAAGINGEKDGYAFIAPVGSFPEGKSAAGCLDLAGNVCEWCLDSYDKFIYQEIPVRNPKVLREQNDWPWKVLRGGSWGDSAIFIRSTYRFTARSEESDIRWGFRYVINPS